MAQQRPRKPLTADELRRREIEQLRNAACWQPLAPSQLAELKRLEQEELLQQTHSKGT